MTSLPTGWVVDLATPNGAPPKKEQDFVRTYVLTHLSDDALLRALDALVAQERTTTAELLAHIAEVDERRLYLPAGFPSMHAYCVAELHLSADAAYKRIQAARTARDFPAILPAVAEGRLHLAAVCLLAPHLTPENAEELLAAAAHKTKSDVERLVAHRFPRTELLPLVQVLPATPALAPGQFESDATGCVGVLAESLAPGRVATSVPRAQVKPLAPERFALQFTIGKTTHDKLRHVQELLSHRLPSGDVAEVFDRSLDALMGQLEKQKYAATTKPRARSRSTTNKRCIPADVKRAVRARDQDQCAFVSASGQRCSSRRFLELDHVDPVARGGEATVENVRMLCRGHNEHEARRVFGAGFMHEKREAARRAAESRTRADRAKAEVHEPTVKEAVEALERVAEAEADLDAEAAAVAEAHKRAIAEQHARDVMGCLRELGFRAGEARRAVEFSATLPADATLEERVRVALRFLCPRTRVQGRVATGAART